MTIFEKIKNMNQDEAVEYIRNGFCKTRKNCKDCPMLHGYRFKDCGSDFFADWLEMQVEI